MSDDEVIGLDAGAGGPAMRRLIEEVLLDCWDRSPAVAGTTTTDGAILPFGGQLLVMTTDSHVVTPRFFPGGDIGRLAVCGTVNDLAVMGATQPWALSCAIVVEEGFSRAELERIAASMRAALRESGAAIVTGDTKVMGRGEVDGLIINTTGVALTERVILGRDLQPNDAIVVSGPVGDHGLTVMAARAGVTLPDEVRSDCAPIHTLVRAALDAAGEDLIALKDPTRGGLAAALHELATRAGVSIEIGEALVPVRPAVAEAARVLGLDPIHLANEGKLVLAVRPEVLPATLAALRAHPLGADAAMIGRVSRGPAGQVTLDDGERRRLLAEPEGEMTPRIC